MYKKTPTISFEKKEVVHRASKMLSMNLAFALMLAGALHSSAASLGQTVTLRKKEAPMSHVLKDVQKQTGYNIFYDDHLVPADLRVTVKMDNKPLKQALDELLTSHDLEYELRQKNIV